MRWMQIFCKQCIKVLNLYWALITTLEPLKHTRIMAKKYSLLFTVMLLPLLAAAHPSHTSGVEYLKNLGQWDGNFLYSCNTPTGDIFLEPNGFTYVVGAPDNKKKIDDVVHGRTAAMATLSFHAYKVKFENAKVPVVSGAKELETYNNYYLGNNPSKWKTGIHPVQEVNYDELYDGIDLHVGSDGSNMKYEFEVAPGANPYIIKLNFDGADRLSVKNGDLVIGTSLGNAIEQKPFVYQMVNGQKRQVACNYKVKGRSVSYEFPEGYNKTLPLVIDPVVVFATFTGSTADNFGFTATYDDAGNFYGGGLVSGPVGVFPVSAGAFQTTFQGGGAGGTGYGCDMSIIKFSPDGVSRIYGTYIGGADNETPHSMFVDANNNLVIAGRTYSSNFPVTVGSFDNTFNGGGDITVTKLNADGTALLASTFIGGPGDDGVNGSSIPTALVGLKYGFGDDARSEVILDDAGNVYIAASTQTNGFPTTVGAVQSFLSGSQDAVVFKFDPSLTNLMYSTYLGGSSDDNAYVLALDPTQANLYVAGGTQGGLPYTGGTYQPFYQGGASDGYIAKFQNSGNYPLLRLTSIGTANLDQCYGIQTDDAGAVYAMGLSVGGQFPVNNVTYSVPNTCQFVIKLDQNLTNNIYSTTFGTVGGSPNATNISPTAFLVDTCENVYVSGWGGQVVASPPSIGFTTGMPITTDAAQSTTDGSDFYFIVLQKNITGLLYGSYMGQNNINGEHVDGGTSRFDKNGVIYQAICGGCNGTGFPTTAGSWSPNNASTNCNLAALKIHFDFLPVVADAVILGDTFGCAPYTVGFQNASTTGGTITWIFDDGSPNSTLQNPTHTFTAPGVYDVMLIVENAAACNQTIDTDIITITVDSGGIDANFTIAKVDTCGPFTASFVNTSSLSGNPGSELWTVYTWDFGDGSPNFTGQTPPLHTFPDTGTYTITLTMLDTSACNPFDSVSQVITFKITRVIAATIGDTICMNTKTVTMPNLSVNGITYHWVFSDGTTSNEVTPTINIDTTGVITAYVIAYNPATCNKLDTSDVVSIIVYPVPTADFAMNPNPHIRNRPLAFINKSTGTIDQTTYAWDFGDGTKSDLKDPPPHMYLRKGTYEICLTVTNPIEGQAGLTCPAVVCKAIAVDIRPIIDIPTAFSPNGDGVNDMLYVRGAAITEIDLKIFNRWGELVFETTTMENDPEGNLRSEGWDGTLRGKEQEMDAFAFVLHATFIDGTTHEEQGNITLIR
jgi:gliding motility-associated-like protein